MKLDQSVAAVVTGGASGLGRATALALADRGVRVAIFDFNAEAGEAFAAEIGGVFCRADVTSDEQVDTGFAKARAAHGQERVLVNCAGTGNAIKTVSRAKDSGALRHFPIDAFARIVAINLVGTFRCIAKSAVGMIPRSTSIWAKRQLSAATTISADSISSTAMVKLIPFIAATSGLVRKGGRRSKM